VLKIEILTQFLFFRVKMLINFLGFGGPYGRCELRKLGLFDAFDRLKIFEQFDDGFFSNPWYVIERGRHRAFTSSVSMKAHTKTVGFVPQLLNDF
jgi:hypothetical protein